jgi:hypothetical protein
MQKEVLGFDTTCLQGSKPEELLPAISSPYDSFDQLQLDGTRNARARVKNDFTMSNGFFILALK